MCVSILVCQFKVICCRFPVCAPAVLFPFRRLSGICIPGCAAILPLIMGRIVDSPALGLGVAVGTLFIYYAYILWFTLAGSKIRSK